MVGLNQRGGWHVLCEACRAQMGAFDVHCGSCGNSVMPLSIRDQILRGGDAEAIAAINEEQTPVEPYRRTPVTLSGMLVAAVALPMLATGVAVGAVVDGITND